MARDAFAHRLPDSIRYRSDKAAGVVPIVAAFVKELTHINRNGAMTVIAVSAVMP